MKRILLINPATPGYTMRLFPPLTLAVLAGAIPDKYDVSIIDENVEALSLDGDLAAISANTYSIRRAYEIAAMCRQIGIPVIMGGNHPSILPEEASLYADSVVVGDGERVWPEVLNDFEGKRLKRIYKPDRYSFELPLLPRRDLLSNRYRFESMETARGCPFNCYFCSVTRFHGAWWRLKPRGLIEQELRQLRGKTLFLVDDNIIGSSKGPNEHTEALFGLFKDHGIRWMGQASVNVADSPDLLRDIRESGCIFLFIGFESLNPAVLKALNKKLNCRNGAVSYQEVIRRIHQHGIGIMGSFIVGTDYDIGDSIRELKEFILTGGIDIPNIAPLTPYPGTKIYDDLCRDKRLFDEQYWLQDPFPLFSFEPRGISTAMLKEALLDLLAGYTGLRGAARLFLTTLKNTRSLRTASYSAAEGVISARVLKQHLDAG